MNHHKFIEFYDVRAAESALRALNKIDIAGKQIKLEPGHPRFEICSLYPLFLFFFFVDLISSLFCSSLSDFFLYFMCAYKMISCR